MTPAVHVHKAGVMQHILRCVTKGYRWHVSGTVPLAKVQVVALKLSSLFDTGLPEKARWYRRTQGKANGKLFLYPCGPDAFAFVLLLTDGTHPARDQERFQDVADKRRRLTFDQGKFELIQLPAKGGKPAWTWRLRQAVLDSQAEAVRKAVRWTGPGQDRRLRELERDLLGLPGFRGVRLQLQGLLRLLHGEWARVHRQDRCPHLSGRRKGYVQLLAIDTMPLDEVVRRMVRGKRPIPRDRLRPPKPPIAAEPGHQVAAAEPEPGPLPESHAEAAPAEVVTAEPKGKRRFSLFGWG